MPSLQRLCIEYCKELQAVPDGLQDISTLKELTIDLMPGRFCSRFGEGGEDFYKIKHVPSLIITNIRPDEKDDERQMEEAAGASQVVADDSEESTLDASPPPPPDMS
ncbi:hypothetical protein RchiOBHm_Chr1g0345761 [Rosa chinensis]|uniref:Uncharacterized protein n=1 Tax=Rosa chinensis TaxID=74649 RepID=A0A2P6SEV1_ROSCH|nr:hypothetical protein RchiOBHm_Chr1g0345761 [Rosa chinensis]